MIDKAFYLLLEPGSEPPDISYLAPFKAIVVLDAEYTTEWQQKVSAWLVASGCRYMMAWGPSCSSWDDSVDWADIDAGGLEDDSRFVLTTWHDNETLEGVFWYSQFCANFSLNDVELNRAVILHISRRDREKSLTWLFDRSKSLAERERDDD